MSLQDHYASRLLHWTDTDRQVEAATFTALFERQVVATPDAVAVICEDVALTYSELDERAQRLACLLESRGAGPERCVALALPRDAELIVAVVAVLKSGAAFLPLDPEYPAARLEFMLADAGPDVVLSTAALAGDLPAQAAQRLIVLDDPLTATAIADACTAPPARRAPGLDSPAYVIYTSGSTGRPKGVVVTHSGIASLVATAADRMGVCADSRVVQFASMSFDVFAWDLSMSLLSGAAPRRGSRRPAGAGTAAAGLHLRAPGDAHDPAAVADRRPRAGCRPARGLSPRRRGRARAAGGRRRAGRAACRCSPRTAPPRRR